MASPVFNEDTLRKIEQGGAFHYDANGNPVASSSPAASAHAPAYNIQVSPNAVFTINGTLTKTAFLLSLVTVSALVGAFFIPPTLYMPLFFANVVISLGLAFWISMKPQYAAIGSIVYAVAEGLFVGLLSMLMAMNYGSAIVANALLGTVAVAVTMLVLYATRLIKVTEKLRSIVVSATLGIMVMYAIGLIGRFLFGAEMAFIFGNSWLSIGISAVIIVVAAFNLMLDFDLIERMNQGRVAKYYEWYAAFGVMVTLVWLYIEILRILAKLQSRD